jgi:hypothetical protein
MATKIVCIVKDNYVINRIVVDEDVPYTYPFPHDLVIDDPNMVYGIGDWYEAAENILYRPVNAYPPDWPTELQHITTPPPTEPEE